MKYDKITTIEQAIQIIAEQAATISRLVKENKSLKDTDSRRSEWLREAKEAAGYDTMYSFDKVWKETLEKAKKYDSENQ